MLRPVTSLSLSLFFSSFQILLFVVDRYIKATNNNELATVGEKEEKRKKTVSVCLLRGGWEISGRTSRTLLLCDVDSVYNVSRLPTSQARQ